MRRCNPYTWSALSPIKATDAMTHPVGQRDGQLFTEPTGGIPSIAPANDGDVLVVSGGAAAWSPALANIHGDVVTMQGQIVFLNNQFSTIIDGLVELISVQTEIINGGV